MLKEGASFKCLKKRLNGIIVYPVRDFSKEVIRDIIENIKSPAKQDCITLRLYFVFLIQLAFELKCAAAYA